MRVEYQRIEWQEDKNGISFDCELDIVVHSSKSNCILLTIPGVDGTVDGYDDKYLRIAKDAQNINAVAVVRISNPFISSFHWESNARQAIEFIEDNSISVCGNNKFELRIIAHSAGASVVAQIAWEYPFISRVLLINPTAKIGMVKIQQGIDKFEGDQITFLVGSKDSSFVEFSEFKSSNKISKIKIEKVEGADHHFSSKAFPVFLKAPQKYLLN